MPSLYIRKFVLCVLSHSWIISLSSNDMKSHVKEFLILNTSTMLEKPASSFQLKPPITRALQINTVTSQHCWEVIQDPRTAALTARPKHPPLAKVEVLVWEVLLWEPLQPTCCHKLTPNTSSGRQFTQMPTVPFWHVGTQTTTCSRGPVLLTLIDVYQWNKETASALTARRFIMVCPVSPNRGLRNLTLKSGHG